MCGKFEYSSIGYRTFPVSASHGIIVILILCIIMCVGASGWETAAAIMDAELSKAEGLIPTL